jgi:DNA-binding SARP family transcriptional activator/tetratricopeptide (TPR) repeat protein
MITLRALGTAEIETPIRTLTPSQEIVFATALYVLLMRPKSVSRRRLTELLWPRVPAKRRAQRLRQTILQLKKAGFAVTNDRNALRCPAHGVFTDFDDLSEHHGSTVGDRPSLEFLPGYCPDFSADFQDWVENQRDKFHALATKALVDELSVARTEGDWVVCDRLARRCRELDPFNETAVLAQAEASAMRGAKKSAVEMLDRYMTDLSSGDPNLRVSASVLRRRITERMPERNPVTPRECTFVGRNREMQALTLNLQAAAAGSGGAAVAIGEAGIGKSRLASELVKFAAIEGIQACRANCRRSDVDRPLSAFLDLIPQLTELRGSLGCGQETLALFKRLTTVDGRANFSSVSVEDAMSTYSAMRSAIVDVLDAIAEEQPVLIVIDDVHWLDPSSTKLLTELLPWAKRKKILFLLTQRTGSSGQAAVFAAEDLCAIKLGPLGSDPGRAIVAEVLDGSSQPRSPELVQRLLSVGEGNPFFLQELGNHWLETGRQRGSPPSINAIIDERLCQLSTEALLVLQAWAVLDINASIERVERLLEYKAHVLLGAVEELSASGMLRAEEQAFSEIAEPLTVRHDLLSTAALARMASPSLEFLHRRAALVLEKEIIGRGTPSSILWACAYHWRHAKNRERAFRALCSCAEHLLEVGLTHDARPAFERALIGCTTDEQRLHVLSRLALSLQLTGQWEESKEILRTARAMQAKTTPDASTHDDVEVALFEARWRAGFEESALLGDLSTCVCHTDASATHRVACGLLALKVATDQNEIATMAEIYQTIKPVLNEPGILPAVRLEFEVVYHSICGDMLRAEQAADTLRGAMRDEQDPRVLSGALCNIGVCYRLAGRLADAEAVFLELFDHSLKNGLTIRTTFALFALVRVYLQIGDIARARIAMQKYEALPENDQDRHRNRDRLYFLVRLALEEGNVAEASQRYRDLLAHTGLGSEVNWRAAVLGLGIRIAIETGAATETVRPMVGDLESAHLHNRGSGWQDYEAHVLAAGLRYCGDADKALRLVNEYVNIRRERGELPQMLTELLGELRESYAVSATRRIEPLSGVR